MRYQVSLSYPSHLQTYQMHKLIDATSQDKSEPGWNSNETPNS